MRPSTFVEPLRFRMLRDMRLRIEVLEDAIDRRQRIAQHDAQV